MPDPLSSRLLHSSSFFHSHSYVPTHPPTHPPPDDHDAGPAVLLPGRPRHPALPHRRLHLLAGAAGGHEAVQRRRAVQGAVWRERRCCCRCSPPANCCRVRRRRQRPAGCRPRTLLCSPAPLAGQSLLPAPQIRPSQPCPSALQVFLLSTRAGGLGINLTAADTCIIYDSGALRMPPLVSVPVFLWVRQPATRATSMIAVGGGIAPLQHPAALLLPLAW